MGDGGRMIVIKGGGGTSVYYDADLFDRDLHDRKRFTNSNLAIARIIIEDYDGSLLYDSSEHPEGLNHVVRVFCR